MKFPLGIKDSNIDEIALEITKHTSELNIIIDNVQQLIKSKYSLEKLSNKLQDWRRIDFEEFLKQLKKLKINLSLQEETDWMQYFNEQKDIAQKLKSEIEKADKQIDQKVYELYGLTDKEIRIVEESVK